jgi:uncharacterized protein (TIGR00251 family)
MTCNEQQCRIVCRVQPRSSRNALAGKLGDAWKIALTAPPVEGKANAALVEFFAKLFNTAKRNISISSGEHSKNKTVIISGFSNETAEAILNNSNGGK